MIAALLGLTILALLAPERADLGATAAREAGVAAARGGTVVRAMRPLSKTICAISIWTPVGHEAAAGTAVQEALDAMERMEERISDSRPSSETAAINRLAGQGWAPLSADLGRLLGLSLSWSRRTGSAFDPTGGPLFDLWRDSRRCGRLPTQEEVRARLALVGWDKVELAGNRVRLRVSGARLGFGAIGEGFGADSAVALLASRGFPNCLVDAGGDLVVRGSRGGMPWSVGIRRPRGDDLLASCELSDCGVATSGNYEEYLSVDGNRYGHVLDLRTGWPARETASATVLAPTGADADALATALVAMGIDRGLSFANSLPGVAALMVGERGEMRLSRGLRLEGERLIWTR